MATYHLFAHPHDHQPLPLPSGWRNGPVRTRDSIPRCYVPHRPSRPAAIADAKTLLPDGRSHLKPSDGPLPWMVGDGWMKPMKPLQSQTEKSPESQNQDQKCHQHWTPKNFPGKNPPENDKENSPHLTGILPSELPKVMRRGCSPIRLDIPKLQDLAPDGRVWLMLIVQTWGNKINTDSDVFEMPQKILDWLPRMLMIPIYKNCQMDKSAVVFGTLNQTVIKFAHEQTTNKSRRFPWVWWKYHHKILKELSG